MASPPSKLFLASSNRRSAMAPLATCKAPLPLSRADSTCRCKAKRLLSAMPNAAFSAMLPPSNTSKKAAPTPANAARDLFRLAHFTTFCNRVIGRAMIGSPRPNAARSSAISTAVRYRFSGAFSSAFSAMVCKSIGTVGFKSMGETGSFLRTCSKVSKRVRPLKGGRPVRNSYKMAPNE